MKKLLLIALLLSCATTALGEAVKKMDQEDLQYNLLDQLNILKIKMDTWLDLSQLDNLLQQAKDVVATFEAMKTTAAPHTMEFKTLTANRNEARKIMNNIYSIQFFKLQIWFKFGKIFTLKGTLVF